MKIQDFFYKALGFEAIEMYTTDKSCVYRINDGLFFMIYEEGALSHHRNIPGVDMSKFMSSSFSLAADSILEIDQMISKAKAAGGQVYPKANDNEMMYGHGFSDPDGNVWDMFIFKDQANK